MRQIKKSDIYWLDKSLGGIPEKELNIVLWHDDSSLKDIISVLGKKNICSVIMDYDTSLKIEGYWMKQKKLSRRNRQPMIFFLLLENNQNLDSIPEDLLCSDNLLEYNDSNSFMKVYKQKEK